MRQREIPFLVLSTIAAANAFGQGSGRSYRFLALDSLGGIYGQALAINNDNCIVGTSYTRSGKSHATLWVGKKAIDLGTLGGETSVARAINDRGQIVGTAQNAVGASRATLWEHHRKADLGTLGGEDSHAWAINRDGVIAGSATFPSPPYPAPSHAVLWKDRRIFDLGTLGASPSVAYAINGVGMVAGASSTRNTFAHAALWTREGVTDLSTTQYSGAARAINDAGVMVGLAEGFTEGYYAAKWVGDLALHLPTLPEDAASYANAINASGQAVGYSEGFGYRALLWEGDEVIDLNTFLSADDIGAGWSLSTANGINDHGWIVGEAANGHTFQTSAYRLVPVAAGGTSGDVSSDTAQEPMAPPCRSLAKGFR